MESIATPGQNRVGDLARQLEEEISFGILPAGTWLKQADLEKRLGCSRIQLREALNRLEEKGLVSLELNRGYRVREVDERRLLQILQIRALLEAEAVRNIVRGDNELDFAELRRLATEFQYFVENGSVFEQEQANRRFHATLLQNCTNQELVSLVFELRNRAPITQNRRKNTYSRLVKSAKEHFELLSLLEQHDVDASRELIMRHVLGGSEPDPR